MLFNDWWMVWLAAPAVGTLVVGAFIAFSASLVRHS